MSRYRLLDRQNRRIEKLTEIPLDPPRGVKYSGGIVRWQPPQETRNVTHFRIYRNDEYTLIKQVPLGQTELRDRIVARRLFISSYNVSTGRESRKVRLGEIVAEGFPQAIIFGIPGTVSIGEDVCPHAEVAVGDGKRFLCLRGYVNAKWPDDPQSILRIDLEYSTDDSTVSYEDLTWTNLFPTTAGDLVLTYPQLKVDEPLTIFFLDPMTLPDRTLVRCNVRDGDAQAAVTQIRGVVEEAVTVS
jgi:hypothetical protein